MDIKQRTEMLTTAYIHSYNLALGEYCLHRWQAWRRTGRQGQTAVTCQGMKKVNVWI